MANILVIVPFPLDAGGVAHRRKQLESWTPGPCIEFDYLPVKAGPALSDSYHDRALGALALLEAGLEAQADGYDAVCIDTMSDSGVNALRSVLDIPVIGPARATYHVALMLGHRFSVLTQWDPWIASHEKNLTEYGLAHKCASVRSINTPPDVRNLLAGKEEEVLPRLLEAAERCVDDGADVLILGSTTMHQAERYLTDRLIIPVLSPGPISYALAELVLGLGLTHSRTAFPRPEVPKPTGIHAMLDAAAAFEERRATEARKL